MISPLVPNSTNPIRPKPKLTVLRGGAIPVSEPVAHIVPREVPFCSGVKVRRGARAVIEFTSQYLFKPITWKTDAKDNPHFLVEHVSVRRHVDGRSASSWTGSSPVGPNVTGFSCLQPGDTLVAVVRNVSSGEHLFMSTLEGAAVL